MGDDSGKYSFGSRSRRRTPPRHRYPPPRRRPSSSVEYRGDFPG